MIELKGVSKTYAKGKKAVDGLSLNIEDGKIIGFLGPNGAGKTTTLKLITGILKADEGSILVDGKPLNTDPIGIKRKIGFVSDDADVFLRLKGIEYVNFMADVYQVPKEIRVERIKSLAERLDMADALKDRIQSYSHGMRQKIIIIGALIHDPKIWILDEPMTGLDPQASFVLKEMMREHAKQGKVVFFSTHVLEVAEKLCDQAAIISKGKIIYFGDVDGLEARFMELTDYENTSTL